MLSSTLYQKFSSHFSTDIGIDLGTANCLVFVKDQGVILNEPSVVAVTGRDKDVLAVGANAKRMLGRTPGDIKAIRPMKDGVIADFQITEEMLKYFLAQVQKTLPRYKRIFGPRVLIAVPSGITEVETRAVEDSASRAGAREVFLIEEPMAAAIGVGLPFGEAEGSMIVDIGGGTTDVAVLSLSGVVEARSVRVGGDEMDAAISQHMKKKYNLTIGERTSEEIKITLGSAYPVKDDATMEVKGRDLMKGLPQTVNISGGEIREALQDPVSSILEAVHTTLERCPPELSADLIDRGIMLAGGGAMLAGLDQLITEETGLPVFVAEEALMAVAKGTGVVLEEIDTMEMLRALKY